MRLIHIIGNFLGCEAKLIIANGGANSYTHTRNDWSPTVQA
jgi:hypothetical protein